jgi:hypothetical protein
MDFFSKDDIRLLHEYQEQEYVDNRRHQTAQQELAAGVWAKTKYWAELVAGEVFEVDYRTSVVRRAGKKKEPGGKEKMIRRFRPFSWAQLYEPGDEAYKVFFTVGVDGEKQELVWKLDCKHDGSDSLDIRQIARFRAYQNAKAPATSWQRVTLDELADWSWEKLAAETQKFLTKHSAAYKEAIWQTWGGHEPGRDKLARVCWNDYGWQRPSGLGGKSGSGEMHEASEGWGAEEWLFDFARQLDGYHYAYLTPIRNALAKHAGAIYNIRLYARDAVSGTYYYVGRLLNAEVLTQEQITATTARYQAQKWLSEMEGEVQAVTGNPTFRLGEDGNGPFNIRFRPEEVERPGNSDGVEIIEDISEWTDSQRYVLFEDVRGSIPPLPKKRDDDELDMRDSNEDNPIHRPRQRLLRAGAVELPDLHNLVQDRLMAHLKAHYPKHLIKREVTIKEHGTRIDAVRQRPDKSRVFYEIKVLPTLRACIREALGQLLEYAHWPAKDLAAELVIVSHYKADQETDAYLTKLNEVYSMQLGYLHISLAEESVMSSKRKTKGAKIA